MGFTEQAMIKGLVLLIGLALAGAAQAQIKCWTGANGKRACGDTPPPGARLETPRGAPAPKVSAPAPAPAATDAKKQGVPAAVPQDQGTRKPPAGSLTAAEKAYLARPPSRGNMEDCKKAQEMLRKTGGGGRSQRTDAVQARALAEKNCP
jgi:Domain of unknown function (DUF4124)